MHRGGAGAAPDAASADPRPAALTLEPGAALTPRGEGRGALGAPSAARPARPAAPRSAPARAPPCRAAAAPLGPPSVEQDAAEERRRRRPVRDDVLEVVAIAEARRLAVPARQVARADRIGIGA